MNTTNNSQLAAQTSEKRDENMWAMLCHLSTLSVFVIPVAFINIIGPLIIWLIKKDEYPLVNDQGKEALNFQITMTIYFIISLFLIIILIGIPILIILGIFDLVITIVATIKSSAGEKYRYPMTIRFVN